jgi:hypothetical protein
MTFEYYRMIFANTNAAVAQTLSFFFRLFLNNTTFWGKFRLTVQFPHVFSTFFLFFLRVNRHFDYGNDPQKMADSI